MKRLFLSVLLLSATASLAQVDRDHRADKQPDLLGQGKLHVGVNVNGGYGGNFVGMTGRVVPRVQYFLKDGWSIALEGRYEANGDFFRHVGAGLSTRYYFIRDRRLAVFGQAGATYGRSRYRRYTFDPANPTQFWREDRANAWQVSAGLGVHYRIANRWSLEALSERTLTNNVGTFRNYGRWQGSVGVNFRLGK